MIDLSEFHDVFFEECFEGLDIMESGLLNLDGNGADSEQINDIFRAAHSIKGAAATFGFDAMSGFSHIMETLLDEMRDGRRAVERRGLDLLLESVDCLREMVNSTKAGDTTPPPVVADLTGRIQQMLAAGPGAVAAAPAKSATAEPEQDGAPAEEVVAAESAEKSADSVAGSRNLWRIMFVPFEGLLKTGNEPARIFRELAQLGILEVKADTSCIPALDVIDPEVCYLSWNLTLGGDMTRGQIEDVFDWVTGQCELSIDLISGELPTQKAAASLSVVESVEPPVAATDQPAPAAAAVAAPASVKEESTVSEQTESSKNQTNAEPAAEAADGRAAASTAAAKDNGSIRVGIDKVDALINMVGELVITQSMLSQIGEDLSRVDSIGLERLRDGLIQLERNTRELQETVLQIRMLPISFAFNRFPRLVRDLSNKLGKRIELKLTGEQTEVDKTVLEKLGDPLVHLVRNSMDHGLESPEVRRASGKSEVGVLELSARHEGGDIVIEVIDDGAGLNRERILQKAVSKGLVSANDDLSDERIYNLIFQPGFSTAEVVSDVSGRGVGMDVVRRNIRDLGGNVTITSEAGQGSRVTIRLPLTLAILDGQLVRVGEQVYIISLVSIVESIQITAANMGQIAGRSELYRLREQYIPVVRLSELFGVPHAVTDLQAGLLVVVESEGRRVGLFVDDLMGQQQVVIKSLETNFRHVGGISGATILGDGTVALILDVAGILNECARAQESKDREFPRLAVA